jgi:hypothetical protein
VKVQAQECCEGGSLNKVIAQAAYGGTGNRLYDYQDALRWMTQAAKALQYLHESNPQVCIARLTMSSFLGHSTTHEFTNSLPFLCLQTRAQNLDMMMDVERRRIDGEGMCRCCTGTSSLRIYC